MGLKNKLPRPRQLKNTFERVSGGPVQEGRVILKVREAKQDTPPDDLEPEKDELEEWQEAAEMKHEELKKEQEKKLKNIPF